MARSKPLIHGSHKASPLSASIPRTGRRITDRIEELMSSQPDRPARNDVPIASSTNAALSGIDCESSYNDIGSTSAIRLA